MSSTPATAGEFAGQTGGSASPQFLRRLLGRKLALVCIGYLVAVVGVAIIAPIVLPTVAGEQAGDLIAARQAPSWHHLLGTDTVGRDVLDRLLVGTRITLVGVVEALLVVLALGVPFGLAAGFFGGAVDRVVNWFADLTFSMPAIIIILIVLSVFPQNMTAGMVTLGVLLAPGLMRVVRSAVLPVREELYIAAARVAGLSRPYIVTRHVLPRVAGPVIVQTSLLAAATLVVQTGLAFLGLLVAVPAPSWGGMVADGVGVIVLQPWLIWPPGLTIAVTILALGFLGDIVRDVVSETWTAPVHRRLPRGGGRAGQDRVEEPTAVAGRSSLDDPLLTVDGLDVSFATASGNLAGVPVIREVSFDVRMGQTVGLVGESGCGKTVTAMAILGLLPGMGRIDAGRIVFAGRDLTRLGERELHALRGREIGLISQEPMVGLNPAFRVGWQLAEVVRCHHAVTKKAARERAVDLLRAVRLTDPEAVAQRYPHELSGGMAQRVAIARALAGEPKLLIADEPTTALDVTVQAEILDLLRELQHARQMAILLVTHDFGVVADICERVVVMYAGQVVEDADVEAIFHGPLHPYTRALLLANPHNAPDSRLLPTIAGAVPRPGEWPVGCHFHPRCVHETEACRTMAVPLEQPAPGRMIRCLHHRTLVTAP